MSTFSWVLLGIGLFIFGQFMMMRPSVRERTLMQLREAARHMGLQPRLVAPPAWLRQESRQLVACYTLIVPGGGWVDRAETGAWAEVRRGDLVERIAAVAATARVVAGVCTGTMLLAHAGVIAGRRAATHHSARRELADLGATVVDDRVVDDGDLITSGGVTSGIDLALWLLEREVSAHMADQVAARMEYRRTRPAMTS